MRITKYRVTFQAKTKGGSLFTVDHFEEIFADNETGAIQRGLKQLPLEVLRRPIVSAKAYRDMT